MQSVASGFRAVLGRLPGGKERLVLPIAAGAVAVLLIVTGVTLLAGGKPGGQAAVSRSGADSGLAPRQDFIPPDELFLPGEPDFIPGVVLERERRTVWTAEDAASWWQDPLKNGEQAWRDRIEKTVDEIMESVP